MRAVAVLETLSRDPQQHPDCCCSLSLALLDTLIRELPEKPALILSVSARARRITSRGVWGQNLEVPVA